MAFIKTIHSVYLCNNISIHVVQLVELCMVKNICQMHKCNVNKNVSVLLYSTHV